jgi:hypothetical protein
MAKSQQLQTSGWCQDLHARNPPTARAACALHQWGRGTIFEEEAFQLTLATGIGIQENKRDQAAKREWATGNVISFLASVASRLDYTLGKPDEEAA